MQVGIVGLPRSGKTTIFNAVTRGSAEVTGWSAAEGRPNLGVAKVPDKRLDRLEQIVRPRRKVYAEVSYVDVPAPPEGLGRSRGIAGQYLNHLQRVDALLVVARAFDDPSVSHVDETIDPVRDVETLLMELAFADLEILERRLSRLSDSFKGAKAPEREALTRESRLLERLKTALEAGGPMRDASIAEDEARLLEGFRFLTAKPLMIVANVGESEMSGAASLQSQVSPAIESEHIRSTALCGRLEMELAQLDPAEEHEFRESLGLEESGLDRMIRLAHEVGDLITFFTGNQNEVRAWTVARGTTALKAAGKVHSDMERGFIRAEVVSFDDLDACGTFAEARRRGLLRQEGKTYVVREGNVLNILFNV